MSLVHGSTVKPLSFGQLEIFDSDANGILVLSILWTATLHYFE